MAAGLKVDIDIKPKFKDLIKIIRGDITRVNAIFAEKMLDEIELTQIQGYLSGSNPGKPSGSTYKRTFKLRKSSKRKVGKITFRKVQAEWRTGLDYAPFVLGSKSQQAGIHKGRWKTTEEVSASVSRNADKIYSESWKEAGLK